MGQPIDAPTDPRWVLALRTAESLEGTILRPETRERLIRIGEMLGLTTFACNLVIAIVQDQARRGYAPEYCPTVGEPELRLVPRPEGGSRRQRLTLATAAIAATLACEAAMVVWLLS